MKPVFFATLGQRPEAITTALDILLTNYSYEEIGIIHTDKEKSGISQSLQNLIVVLQKDYDLPIFLHEVKDQYEQPIIDIVDERTSTIYYRSLIELFIPYREQRIPIHLMIAGGRKAMSIYATLAASLLFGINDIVWTIISSPNMLQSGLFHLPSGHISEAQVIELPLRTSRLLPSTLNNLDIDSLLSHKPNPREDFLYSLTAQEKILVDILQKYTYASNTSIADKLGKSPKTIENQFRNIYAKLQTYFDLELNSTQKRQALLDVLEGRI